MVGSGGLKLNGGVGRVHGSVCGAEAEEESALATSVFYSFHYERDAWRVQQVMQMGALEGQPLLNPQDWEKVKQRGNAAVEKWIHDQMNYKSAVVVLVGADTANRDWVLYEIGYAWRNKKPLVGIRIDGLADKDGTDLPGPNPFERVKLQNGGTVADYVPLYAPTGYDSRVVYAQIKANLATWVESAYKRP